MGDNQDELQAEWDAMEPMVRIEGMPIEHFDRSLPSTHSYLSRNIQPVPGRSILEAGWRGRVVCWIHGSVVFPGETIPMVFPHTMDIEIMQRMIQADRLFGLVFRYDEQTPAYGVMCEVTEASFPSDTTPNQRFTEPLTVKSIARYRLVVLKMSDESIHRYYYNCEVEILPDIILKHPLTEVRLFNIGHRKNALKSLTEGMRRVDAIVTPWPYFLYDIYNEERLVGVLRKYFKNLGVENLPNDTLSLSYWVGTNLPLSIKDRFALFRTNNVLLRLCREEFHIKKKKIHMCCSQCGSRICSMSDVFAMSSEGFSSNFCNIGGYVHDTITLTKVTNVSLQGPSSSTFSWFPGYSWTIALCETCGAHVGWRFDASKVCLSPMSFWGLTRRSLNIKHMSPPTLRNPDPAGCEYDEEIDVDMEGEATSVSRRQSF